jgi:hypothetical protein
MHEPREIVDLPFFQGGPIDKPNYGKFNVLNTCCASQRSHLSLKNKRKFAPPIVLLNFRDFPVLARERVHGNGSPVFPS